MSVKSQELGNCLEIPPLISYIDKREGIQKGELDMDRCDSMDFFEKHPELKESIFLIQEKRRLVEDWNSKEVRSWLPAEEFTRTNLRPGSFSSASALVIALMTITVLPMFIFAIPIGIMFSRRNRKVEKIRNIQHQLNSTLPTCFKPHRDFVPEEQMEYVYALMEEGLVF